MFALEKERSKGSKDLPRKKKLNERDSSGTVRVQGTRVTKVEDTWS